MTEEEARQWVSDRYGDVATGRLETLVDLIIAETNNQNLVSASTLDTIWNRHVVDSAQLIDHAGGQDGVWLDIGTGAGFPGLVVAVLREAPVTLVEPRRKRAEFLTIAAGSLSLSARVTVLACKVETVQAKAAIISARAVAPVDALLRSASQCASADTLWLLPKGQRAREEVAQAQQSWHGMFHVEHSITDPNSLIVIASKVSRR